MPRDFAIYIYSLCHFVEFSREFYHYRRKILDIWWGFNGRILRKFSEVPEGESFSSRDEPK